jgi:thioesterase domain-containing protein
MALMTRLIAVTGRKLPLTTLFQAPTVAALAAHLRADAPRLAGSTLVPFQPLGSRPPVFLVPELETSALNLVKLVRFMGARYPVYGLHPRGFDDGLAPHRSIAATAAGYLSAIQAVRPDGPYLLAGICYGGLVAFEMAQQLQRQGQPVPLLALIDVSGLNVAQGSATERAGRWWRSRRRRWQRWQNFTRETLGPVLHSWRGTPVEDLPVDAPSRRATRHLRYAQKIAHLNYWAASYSGPVCLLQSGQHHQRGIQADWQRAVPSGLEVTVLPGVTHNELLTREPLLRQTADWLIERLDRCA